MKLTIVLIVSAFVVVRSLPLEDVKCGIIISVDYNSSGELTVNCRNECVTDEGSWLNGVAYKKYPELNMYNKMVQIYFSKTGPSCTIVPFKTDVELSNGSVSRKEALDGCFEMETGSPMSTTASGTSFVYTTVIDSTIPPTTSTDTTIQQTTTLESKTTIPPTTGKETTVTSTTEKETTVTSTTEQETTSPSTTRQETTSRSTTGQETTSPSTTGQETTSPSTTGQETTSPSTTGQETTSRSSTGQETTIIHDTTISPTTVSEQSYFECKDGYMMIGSKCYMITPTQLSLEDASNYCQQNGGEVSIINSEEEQDLLKNILYLDLWVGTNDRAIEGQFEPSGYQNWAEGEPNNMANNEDCTMLSHSNAFKWNDDLCDKQMYTLCETDPIEPPRPVGCPAGYTLFRSSCYHITENSEDYDTSARACYDDGSFPIFINDQQEQDFIASTYSSNGENFYIGYNDRENESKFKSNQFGLALFTSWIPEEPNNINTGEDCIEMRSDSNYNWNDLECFLKLRMICESDASTSPCPEGYHQFEDSCFFISSEKKNFNNAISSCLSMGAKLAPVNSEEESSYLKGLVDEVTMLGYKRVARHTMNDFARLDGKPMTYHGWNTDEPNDTNGNEECVQMQPPNNNWNDYYCQDEIKYICRKPAAQITN